jgi:Zn-dependent protease with chaperone function
MSTFATSTTSSCPDCAEPLPSDPRFPVWCPACEWNLVRPATAPTGRTPRLRRKAEQEARRTAARERSVRARTESVHELVASGARQSRDRAWLAAMGLAGLVHLVTLALFVSGVLLVSGGTWPLRILGGFALAFSYLLRPRFGRHGNRAGVLTRAKAPALHALADRVAAEVGSRPVDAIQVTTSFSASISTAGLLRRTRLSIGLPLWVALTSQQRVALLGHEFGHNVNGDHRRGLWLGSANAALREWFALTRPEMAGSGGRGLVLIGTWSLKAALRLINLAVYGLLVLLDRLTTRSGQAAEYHADALGARVGSTEAARGMLEVLLLEPSFETIVNRRRNLPRHSGRRAATQSEPTQDLWTEVADQFAEIPPLERERRLRLSERELGTVDSTHPPTYLRISMLGVRPVPEAAVILGTEEAAAIDAELAPYLRNAAARLTNR